MSARFEIVRTDAEQSWHARMIVGGRITWDTENHTRQVGAERAIVSLLREVAGGSWGLRWNGDSTTEKVAVNDVGMIHPLTVLYVDERTTWSEWDDDRTEDTSGGDA